MKKRTIASLVISAIWALLVWSGISGIQGIVEQHADGYPSTGQVVYYVGVPILAFALSLLSAIACQKLKWDTVILLPVILIFLLPLYILFYGGGV